MSKKLFDNNCVQHMQYTVYCNAVYGVLILQYSEFISKPACHSSSWVRLSATVSSTTRYCQILLTIYLVFTVQYCVLYHDLGSERGTSTGVWGCIVGDYQAHPYREQKLGYKIAPQLIFELCPLPVLIEDTKTVPYPGCFEMSPLVSVWIRSTPIILVYCTCLQHCTT